MGRNSNDDRANSLNPEHPAYWASLNNHRNQVGDYDDYDDEACGPTYVPSRVSVVEPARIPQPGDAEMPIVVVLKTPEPSEYEKKMIECYRRMAEMLSRL